MNKGRKFLIFLFIILIIIAVFFILFAGERHVLDTINKPQIVVSNFASYDFLRTIVGDEDDTSLIYIVGPGKDSHSFDPTPGDIIDIQESDLFVYIGGDMENWVQDVLNVVDEDKTSLFCISDYVEMNVEKNVDGVEEEKEEDYGYDEHIWTSPKEAIQMVNVLEDLMETINPDKANIYKENANNYINEINEIDSEIQEVVNLRVRDRLVFGDKMPMQYFIDYYGLEVSAAYKGCSTEIDPNTKTVAYLIDKVKEEEIPVVLYVELSSGQIAKQIAEETGAKAMQIQTLHNISKDDFENGETWVSLMRRNIDVLKEALW